MDTGDDVVELSERAHPVSDDRFLVARRGAGGGRGVAEFDADLVESDADVEQFGL